MNIGEDVGTALEGDSVGVFVGWISDGTVLGSNDGPKVGRIGVLEGLIVDALDGLADTFTVGLLEGR